MPMPSTAQAAARLASPLQAASAASPPASTRLEAIRMLRPPWRSMIRPMLGPAAAESSSDTEKAPKTQARETPADAAMSSARIAGR